MLRIDGWKEEEEEGRDDRLGEHREGKMKRSRN